MRFYCKLPLICITILMICSCFIAMAQQPEEPIPGPKIEGPWLWAVVPMAQDTTGAVDLGRDHLAAFTNGAVTEQQIARNGTMPLAPLADTGTVWVPLGLPPTDPDNITTILQTLHQFLRRPGDIDTDNQVAYGSIILNSPRRQNTLMFAGSDDNHKVWLNGQLVNEQLNWHWDHDYQESFPVTLKRGENVLLVAVQNGAGRWGGYFGFEEGTAYSVVGEGPVEEGIVDDEPVEEAITDIGGVRK